MLPFDFLKIALYGTILKRNHVYKLPSHLAQVGIERHHCLCSLLGLSHPGGRSEAFPGVDSVAGAKFLFDAKELIVLGQTLRSARSTGLDLAGAETNGKVSNVCVFGFSRSVRSHDTPSSFLGLNDGGD